MSYIGMTCSGWVYLLTNASMPGLIKIGLTTTSVEQRVEELSSSTSVPTKFKIEAVYSTVDVAATEKAVHGLLDAFRFNAKREFFQLKVEAAKMLIQRGVRVAATLTQSPTHFDSKLIGEAIKRVRKQRHLTQSELGLIAGIAPEQICRYEAGKGNGTVQNLGKICKALRLKIALIPDEDGIQSGCNACGWCLDCLREERSL